MSSSRPSAPQTFQLRRGRYSQRQEDGLAQLYPKYGVKPDGELDFETLFGRAAPVVLEVGSGMGDATAEMAAGDPDRDYLAIEVHPPGIANLLWLIEERGLTNIRVFDGDALAFVHDVVAPGSLDAVHVFFPDPWPKVRHHKRRLISPPHTALLRSRLRANGTIHCATDWAEYGEVMLETLDGEPGLANLHEGFAPRMTSRPVTKFEQRGIAAGRTILDLEFRRVEVN